MKDSRLFLPKVGDHLMRTMTSANLSAKEKKPEPCIVTYVNYPKQYYQVTFIDSGIKECYKIPSINELDQFVTDYYRAFGKKPNGVYVYESGALYSSISECARAIGVRPCTVSKHIHGRTNHVKGYHIYMLD